MTSLSHLHKKQLEELEEIKAIEGYGGDYGVNKRGDVYSYKYGRNLKIKKHDFRGYDRVFLCKNNKNCNFKLTVPTFVCSCGKEVLDTPENRLTSKLTPQ